MALEEFVEVIREAAPGLLEQFYETYEDPIIRGAVCWRCGATVGEPETHIKWHMNISLSIYALGSTVRHLLGEDSDDQP